MATTKEQDSTETPLPPLRVLIVDNDASLAEAMEEALEREGYQITVATSGPEGARRVEQDQYDVVLTDLVMNDLDGMEVLARAKQSLPEAEVVLITGHATVPKAVEAMQQGAYNFLEKPITPQRLRVITAKAAEAAVSYTHLTLPTILRV